MKTFSTLREAAEAKDQDGNKAIGGLTKSTSFRISPLHITIDTKNAIRPIDPAHVEQFRISIAAGTGVPPVYLRITDQGYIDVVEGRHRVTAYQQLIAENVIPNNVMIDAIEFKGSDSDAVCLSLTSEQGKQSTPLERAFAYKVLIDDNWTQKQIAQRVGKTIAHVSQMLKLTEIDPDIQGMVKRGDVSASVALAKVKKHGKEAKYKLVSDIVEAQTAGKKKVTGKSLKPVQVISGTSNKSLSDQHKNKVFCEKEKEKDRIFLDIAKSARDLNDNLITAEHAERILGVSHGKNAAAAWVKAAIALVKTISYSQKYWAK